MIHTFYEITSTGAKAIADLDLQAIYFDHIVLNVKGKAMRFKVETITYHPGSKSYDVDLRWLNDE